MRKEKIKTRFLRPENEKITKITCFFSVLLTALLSVSFSLMLTSTYNLEVDVETLIIGIILFSVGATIFHAKTIKRPWLSIGLIILAPILTALLIYTNFGGAGSGFGHLFWNLREYSFRNLPSGTFRRSREPEEILAMLLLFLNFLPIAVTTWVLVKRKNVFFALLTYVPFLVGSVALNYMFPSQIWCVLAVTGVITLIIFHNLRHGEARTTDRKMLSALAAVLAVTMVVGMIYPLKSYDKQEVAERDLYLIKHAKANEFLTEMFRRFYSLFRNSSKDDMTQQGDTELPEFLVMRVTRDANMSYPDFHRSPLYLYIKTASRDTYEENTWFVSESEPELDQIFGDYDELPSGPAMYHLKVHSYVDSDVLNVPYYTDFLDPVRENNTGLITDIYPNVRQRQLAGSQDEYEYSISDIPLQRDADLWSDAYLKYVSETCTYVPESTVKALLDSNVLPQWYLDVYNGETQMTDYDKIRAVSEYVSKLCPYDEKTSYPPDDQDFVVWFMTQSKTGYCVHYATTAVILLRMLGVPARYVTGYMVDTLNNGYEKDVLTDDAHAWFEVFLPEFGWVMGDATPGNSYAASHFDVRAISDYYGISLAPLPDMSADPRASDTPSTSTTPTPTTDPDRTPTPVTTMGPLDKETGTPASTTGKKDGNTDLPIFWIVILLLIALLCLVRLLYDRSWRNAFRNGSTNERARAYFRYFALISRKLKGRPSARSAFIAQKAAFSDQQISEKELDALVSCGRKELDALIKKRPWYHRWAVLILYGVKV